MNYKLAIASGLYPENQFKKKELNKIWPETDALDHSKLDAYFQNLVSPIPVDPALSGWCLRVQVRGMAGQAAYFYPGGTVYPATQEKSVDIFIPLPTADIAPWGIQDPRRFPNYAVNHANARGAHRIPVDYSKHDSLKNYMESTIQTSLKALFTHGIRLKGLLIKF